MTFFLAKSGEFQSGQMGQTVNLLRNASMVRIHLLPPFNLIILIIEAGVAQLVEQLICNQQVGGSSPSTSSIFLSIRQNDAIRGRIPEWPNGADCKSVA